MNVNGYICEYYMTREDKTARPGGRRTLKPRTTPKPGNCPLLSGSVRKRPLLCSKRTRRRDVL